MIRMSLSKLAALGLGSLCGNDIEFAGISIDTRSLVAGNVFVAIKGENFDGHDFVEAAQSRGATGLIVSQQVDTELPYLLVNDTRQTLREIASHWRQAFNLPLVAITGSNGKTTVKEMVASIFRSRGKTLSTHGNLNNELGVPLTLARLDDSDQFAVIEIGANHAGEIESIVQSVHPDIAVVTMIGPSHLEGFGSIEGVAAAKSEIFSGLSDFGTAILNRDDAFYSYLKTAVGNSTVISFGCHREADVFGTYQDGIFVIHRGENSTIISLQLLGKHNRLNALAAAAIAIAAGFSLQEIKKGLESMRAVKGRLQRRPEITEYRVIDDSYNANPASMKAAIDVLVEQPGVTCAVLGDMGELGQGVHFHHADVGQYAKLAGVDYLIATGPYMKSAVESFGAEGALHCDTKENLVDRFTQMVPKSANVLVKGSRSAGMDVFIEMLLSKEHLESVSAESTAEGDF